jgi:phage terminase Nu1 subunit (DNA packaging protein)
MMESEQAPRRRGRPPAPGEALQAARRRKEVALADLRELEVNRRRGQLLDATAVEREWAGVLRAVRAGVLAVASRVRARLPHLTAHDAQVLDEELRAALAALGEDRGDAQ